MRGRLQLLVGTVVLASCAAEESVPVVFTVADSAGVQVVATEISKWESEPSWVLSTEPAVRIGAMEGDDPYLFADIAGVVGLADGRIVVADGLSREIRFFSSAGEFVRSVGGTGDGPGEYADIAWIARCGEGLQVFSRRHRRLTSLTLDGDLIETALLETPGEGSVPYRSRCGPDGSLVLSGWGVQPEMRPDVTFQFFGQEAPVWWLPLADGDPIALGNYISSERVLHYDPTTGRGGSGPHPFGRAVSFAIGRAIYIGNADRLQVEERDRAGRLVRLMRGPDDDLLVDDEFLAEYRSLHLSGLDSVRRARLDDNEMPMPTRLPAYTEIRIDPLGYIWVERFRAPWDERSRWGVFQAEGEFLGHVELPSHFQLLDIAASAVLGVSRDDFDIERVEVYQLERGTTPPPA